MSGRAYVLVLLGALVSLTMILRAVRIGKLRAKYAIIWMGVGLVLLPLAVVPGLLDRLARLTGVAYPPALLLVLGLGFFAMLSLHFSQEMSRLEERTRLLAEELALLRESIASNHANRDETP